MAKKGKVKSGETERLYLESLASTLTGWNDPEARVARALEQNEFLLFGQSAVPLNKARGLPPYTEVLIRLQEEERNLTPPGAFLPIFEYLEMMPALDRWVIEHAAKWWRAGGSARDVVLGINLSGDTLGEAGFPAFVERQADAHGLPPQSLCFELVATEIVVAPLQMERAAKKLNSLGCRFAITSFGRDSISFDALKTVAASLVKIDGAMVKEIHRDAVALAKVRSIQQVCGKAGIRTVAEFVEHPETLKLLKEIGVDYAQGYGVARPAPLDGAPAGTA